MKNTDKTDHQGLFLKAMTMIQAIGVVYFLGMILGWRVVSGSLPVRVVLVLAGVALGMVLVKRLDKWSGMRPRVRGAWIVSSIIAFCGIGFHLPRYAFAIFQGSHSVMLFAGLCLQAAMYGIVGAIIGAILSMRLPAALSDGLPAMDMSAGRLPHLKIWLTSLVIDVSVIGVLVCIFLFMGMESGSWAGVLVPVIPLMLGCPLFFFLLAILYTVHLFKGWKIYGEARA